MSTQSRAINVSETLKGYAAGAMQKGTRRVGNFLAPTVLVPAPLGKYKKWNEKSRFYVPNTLLALGGGAAEVAVDAEDADYDCQPHGLDYIVDQAFGEDVPDLVKDGSDFLADVFGLAHLLETVGAAKAAAGAGLDVNYDANVDPVEVIDGGIEDVLLAGKCEEAGVLFGARAWRRFKDHPAVRGRGLALRWDLNPTLFTADAEYKGCFSVVDTTEGVAPVMEFLLKDEVIVFGRHPVPNRRDPSFMKTLRFEGAVEKLRVVPTKDGRRLQVLIDWSAEIKVTNALAVKRINYLPAA